MTADGFFDPHQRATVEAAMARIIPTDDTPGAREAGTIDFLDRYLSGLDHIYARPDGSGFEKLEGRRAEAWQRRLDIIRERYVEGIGELDRRSRAEFGTDFAELTGGEQDWVLAALEGSARDTGEELDEARAVAGFAPVETPLQQTSVEVELDFFPLLALHTRQGFYADPIYGGNQGQVGWNVIGFPGPTTLAEVHSGRYSVVEYFADPLGYPGEPGDAGELRRPGKEDDRGA
jgi:gluconate 2-dehydrogenase gamma chain